MVWHARLSASTAKRWLNCPGSIREIERLYAEHPQLKEKDEASPYAAEGTAAHHLLEHCLKGPGDYEGSSFIDPRSLVGGAVTKEGAIFGPDQVVKMMVGWHEVTEDMAEAVAVGVDFVLEELDRLGPGTELYLERKWDMTWLHPDLGGTSDVTLSQFLVELVVLDYKHGKGVIVDVTYEGPDGVTRVNEQGMCYLLGAAKVDDFSHERYTVGIIQPRARHLDGPTRTATVTRAELLEFAERLRLGALETASPDAVLLAGEWCTFCPKSGNCLAQEALARQVAGMDFDDLPLEGQELELPPAVDLDALAVKLAWVPVLDKFCRGVEALAQKLQETGVRVPGQKLVRKKTNRKLKEAVALREAAERAGLDPLKLYNEPKLKSPAQVEKLGKPWKALVNSVDPDTREQLYIFKPEGKVTMAPESDPRPEVDPSAVSDFSNLDEEDED